MAIATGAGIVGVSSFLVYSAMTSSRPDVADSSVPQVAKTKNQTAATSSGLPVRLQISKLDVDAKILYMGLTPDGDMDVADDNFQDVGWYQYGARPGDEGTSVIAGHVNGVRERGIFIKLHTLEIGDIVTVLDDKAQTSTFRVREIRSFDQNDRPKEVFQSTKGSHLNLITCAGSWNSAEQRFPVRLVVFTDKIGR